MSKMSKGGIKFDTKDLPWDGAFGKGGSTFGKASRDTMMGFKKDGKHREDGFGFVRSFGRRDGKHHKDGGFGFGRSFIGRRDGKVAPWAQIMHDDSEMKTVKTENGDDCEEKVCVNKPLKMEKNGSLVRFIPYKKSKKHTVPRINDTQFKDLMEAVQSILGSGKTWQTLSSADKGRALKEIAEFQKVSEEYKFAEPDQWKQVLEELGIRHKAVKGENTTDYNDMKLRVREAIDRYAAKPDEHGNLRRVALDDLQYKKFINKYLKEVKKYYLEGATITPRSVADASVQIQNTVEGKGANKIAAITTKATQTQKFFRGKGLYEFYDEKDESLATPSEAVYAKATLAITAAVVKDQVTAAGGGATSFPDLEYFEKNRDVIGRMYLKDDKISLQSLESVDKEGIWEENKVKVSVFTFITAYDKDLAALKILIETMYNLFISQTDKFLREEINEDRDKKWTDGGKRRGMKSAKAAPKAAPRRSARLAHRGKSTGKVYPKSKKGHGKGHKTSRRR